MDIMKKSIIFIFLVGNLIQLMKCAPTGIDETLEIVNGCEIDQLTPCKNDDHECENKNNEAKLKKQREICEENPQCPFCNLNSQIDILDLHNNDLIAEPEIVPTLSPPSKISLSDGIPIDETIVIDTDVSSITENQPTGGNKRDLAKLVERNIVIENDNETQYYRGYIDPSSNITTIIRLTNLINNTNIVHMPTTLNNTNINNIHVYSNKSSTDGGKFGLGYTEEGPCCWSMKPGSCKRTTSGSKCQHKRSKVCGRQCTRKMIHPNNRRCTNIPQWPYVICPIQQSNPFYPPYPQPPFEDDLDDLPLFPEDEELLKAESGWVIMQEKCKIVSEDGLHISNCTENNTEFEHPYARNSIDDQSKRFPRHTGKLVQNVPEQFQQQSPYMAPFYGYPMMQPIYLQPIPIYIPQYFPPQQPYISNYPQQLPFPPLDSDYYYDEPTIESKETHPYRKSKKHNKKHPIIIEHDDEL